MCVDRPADERATRSADDQTGRAVRSFAAIAAFGIPPDLSVITLRHRGRWDDRHDHRRGRGGQKQITHELPFDIDTRATHVADRSAAGERMFNANAPVYDEMLRESDTVLKRYV